MSGREVKTPLFLCRYREADGECGTPISLDAESPSGFAHAEGHGWLHWASPVAYGPQDSQAAFVKRPVAAQHLKREQEPAPGDALPLCETTSTPRLPCALRCGTYPGNLGPCEAWEEGGNRRCVYCDHGKQCHAAQLGPDVARELARSIFKAHEQTMDTYYRTTMFEPAVVLIKAALTLGAVGGCCNFDFGGFDGGKRCQKPMGHDGSHLWEAERAAQEQK